jgi:hypothetical protein
LWQISGLPKRQLPSTSQMENLGTVVVANGMSRAAFTVALIVLATGLAFLGRIGLDWLVSVAPDFEGEIERVGGGILGMVVGLLVVVPVFRMYGVFGQGADGAQLHRPESVDDAEVDDTTARR